MLLRHAHTKAHTKPARHEACPHTAHRAEAMRLQHNSLTEMRNRHTSHNPSDCHADDSRSENPMCDSGSGCSLCALLAQSMFTHPSLRCALTGEDMFHNRRPRKLHETSSYFEFRVAGPGGLREAFLQICVLRFHLCVAGELVSDPMLSASVPILQALSSVAPLQAVLRSRDPAYLSPVQV